MIEYRMTGMRAVGTLILSLSTMLSLESFAAEQLKDSELSDDEPIKSYCIDFNWALGHRAGFAKPGTWAKADPKEHVAWYKAIGANVIQTFAVSCNGYAWYKSDMIPEQPGLEHDFLTEMVNLGHAEGMKVMGYFCIAANTRWGKANPELSYGTPSSRHIPYTDEYLAYLSAAITDAIKTTGIDGFMIDWVWMPNRRATDGKWIDAEKKLYEQLMGEAFPGEKNLSKEQELAYGQKAIDRCWKTIREAAKEADPNCIIWLTSNSVHSRLVKDSTMYKEVDWFMGESGKLDEILEIRPMVGEHTRPITCMSGFGGNDAAKDVPEAMEAGVGVYGYAKPSNGRGIIDLDRIFPKQMSELTGNAKRIAVMARAYRGRSADSVWKDGDFVEPESLPPLRLRFKGRGNSPDTGRIDFEGNKATIHVNTPVQAGRAKLTRVDKNWPAEIVVLLLRKNTGKPAATDFRVANGTLGVSIVQGEETQVVAGEMEGNLDLYGTWRGGRFFQGGTPEKPIKIAAVQAATTEKAVEIVIPEVITRSNPTSICFEWGSESKVR